MVTHDFPSKILSFLEPTQKYNLITHVYISLQHVSTCCESNQVTYLSKNED